MVRFGLLFVLLVFVLIVAIVIVVVYLAVRRSGAERARVAADPATHPATLGQLAQQYAQLRPAIAANPAAYPELLAWLGQQRDPAVDAALRARGL
jgi:cytochrome c-type biogenesis protein CcmH/NrfG